MGWISKMVSSLRRPADEFGGAARLSPAVPPPAERPGPSRGPRSSQQALSGYGNNPYDTYTWELHEAPDGERALKHTNNVGRKAQEGDKTNPYDTGAFRGGW